MVLAPETTQSPNLSERQPETKELINAVVSVTVNGKDAKEVVANGNGVDKAGNESAVNGSAKDPSDHSSQVSNLPPPEISSQIPCRFFASGNCKYGDQCVFAHIPGYSAPPPIVMPIYYQDPNMYYPPNPQYSSATSHSPPSATTDSTTPPAVEFHPHYPHYAYYPYPYAYPYPAHPQQSPVIYPAPQPEVSSPSTAYPQPSGQQPVLPLPQSPNLVNVNGSATGMPQPPYVGFIPHFPPGTGGAEMYGMTRPDMAPSMITQGGDNPPIPYPIPYPISQPGFIPRSPTHEYPPLSPGGRHERSRSMHMFHAPSGAIPVPISPHSNLAALPRLPTTSQPTSPNSARPPLPPIPHAPHRRVHENGMTNGNGNRPRFNSYSSVNSHGSHSSRVRPPCAFFDANRCRNGDECQFPHLLPDGRDARELKVGMIGVDGRTEHPEPSKKVILPGRKRDPGAPGYYSRGPEDKHYGLTNGATGAPYNRDTRGVPYVGRNSSYRLNGNNGQTGSVAAALAGLGKRNGQVNGSGFAREQRVPGEADFPALPVPASTTSRSGSRTPPKPQENGEKEESVLRSSSVSTPEPWSPDSGRDGAPSIEPTKPRPVSPVSTADSADVTVVTGRDSPITSKKASFASMAARGASQGSLPGRAASIPRNISNATVIKA